MQKMLAKALTAGFILVFASCSEIPPKFSVKQVVIEGDAAQFVGKNLTNELRIQNVRISESVENGPVITGKSTIQKMGSGVEVFTLELTDGSDVFVREVVSTQDFAFGAAGVNHVRQGIDKCVASLIEKMRKKRPTTSPAKTVEGKVEKDPKRYFSTS